jgi:hypothetical protein
MMNMISMETEDKGSCTSEVEVNVHNTRSVLLTEFVNWAQKKKKCYKITAGLIV